MRSSLKSNLKVSLISLILIFSLSEVSQAHDHQESYAHNGRRQGHNPNWMSALPDSVRLSELSIPGTHESMARFGTDHAVCQSMTLRDQLESGIRVLDIRCAYEHVQKFRIHHGFVDQKVYFEYVLDTVVDFLSRNRRETVLMRVKEEYTDGPVRFEETFRRYWNRYKDHMWNVPTLAENYQNPTLGEMRGKIVILQDFARWQCNSPSSKGEFGLCYPQPGTQHFFPNFKIQDAFELRGNDALYDKWLKVKAHLCAANTDVDKPGNKDIIYMNYLSGSGVGTSHRLPFPYFVVSGHWNPATGANRLATTYVAFNNQDRYPDFPRLHSAFFGIKYIYYEGTNTLTYGGIRTGYYTKRVGIIMTDFPGWGLINRIICLNDPNNPCRNSTIPRRC